MYQSFKGGLGGDCSGKTWKKPLQSIQRIHMEKRDKRWNGSEPSGTNPEKEVPALGDIDRGATVTLAGDGRSW